MIKIFLNTPSKKIGSVNEASVPNSSLPQGSPQGTLQSSSDSNCGRSGTRPTLRASHLLSGSIFGGRYQRPHFTGEKTEPQQPHDVPRFTPAYLQSNSWLTKGAPMSHQSHRNSLASPLDTEVVTELVKNLFLIYRAFTKAQPEMEIC